MEVHGNPRASTLPKMNPEVSFRESTSPCYIVGPLVLICREKFLLGSVLRHPDCSLEARYPPHNLEKARLLNLKSYTKDSREKIAQEYAPDNRTKGQYV
jgi:hypothetical protein